MLSTKKLLYVFVPALILVGVGLFVRITQYEPLREPEEKKEEIKVVTVPIYPDDPIIGNKKSSITIIVFEDFGCPACRDQSAVLDELISKYPKRVKVVWKGLPVTEFPHPTELAQRYGYCAHRQEKFEPFTQFAFENLGNLSEQVLDEIVVQIGVKDKTFRDCLNGGDSAQYIERVKQIARYLNIQAVPTTFLDGKQIQAPLNVPGWETLLNLQTEVVEE